MNTLRRSIVCLSLLALLSSCLIACSSKSTTIPTAAAIGTTFPSVTGKDLHDKKIAIPQAYRGKNTLVLIGYKQKTQFDIDRWILGALQAELPVAIVELPTIAGMMPSMVQNFINSGMRKGIPQEDWSSVVTVYEDAPRIIAALGNEAPQNTLAVLLDKQGVIRWISRRGYSATQILELKKLLRQ